MAKEIIFDPTPLYLRKRYLIFLLGFFGYLNLYTMRVDFTIAIIKLTENRTVSNDDGSYTYEQHFNWSTEEKGIALSTFFYGYIGTQIIGGYIASKFSGRLVFGTGILGAAVMTFFTPILCYQGISYLYVSRIIIGICSGLSYPSINAVYDKWCPPYERSRVSSFGISGVYVGTIIGLSMSGYIAICHRWEWIFYGFGIVATIWAILWFIIIKDSPADDNWILKSEKKFILDSLNPVESPGTPWRAILTSLPVYAIGMAHFAYCWGYNTYLTIIPLYLQDVLDYDTDGHYHTMISCISYILITLLLFPSGYLADWLQMNNYLSTTQVRKFFNNISFFLQMALLLMSGYFKDLVAVIACSSLSVGLGALAMSGFLANSLDIAPQYSSIILGISNSFAVLPGVLMPFLSGHIIQTPSDSEYKTMFFIASAVYLFGFFFYAIFASGKVQPWAILHRQPSISLEILESDVKSQNVSRENSKYRK
ncbi:hypothetical protein ACKWTF_004681 [Chironomus riparius]